ncbi:MAG: FAD-dependent oxidoreductase [Thermomicrobiales bacterium]|nr:FAD-dependent oxidoreductase [Thermomicrobiales bacterium]
MSERVIVIGAGIVGLTTAWSLHQRGWRVTVVDARTPGYGASRVNAGRICPTHSDPVPAPGLVKQSIEWMRRSDSPLYIQPRPSPDLSRFLYIFWRHCNQKSYDTGSAAMAELGRQTVEQLAAIRASGVEFEEHDRGTLHVYESRARLEADTRASEEFRSNGDLHVSEMILGDDLRQLEPALSDHVIGGYMVHEDRLVRPDSLTAGLADWLTERGVEIRTKTEVTGLDVSNGRVTDVRFASGRLETDAVVIAAGTWSPILAKMAGRRVPIQPGKGYSLDYTPAPVELRNQLSVDAGRHAVSPFDGMTRLAGTMELSGINERIRPERVEAIIRSAARTFQGWPTDVRIPTIGSGMRPLSADGLPLIGWLKGYRNLSIAAGHGMLGLSLSASTGEALADLMTTGRQPDVLKPFDPARFGRMA